MELQLELRNYGTSNGVFIIPKVFLDTKFANAFSNGKCLIIGKRYRLTIEEVKQ